MSSNQTGTTKVTYLISDPHGTSSLAINRDTALTFTKRYTTPFGADRGKPLYGPWPDDKGFLGKTRDASTGLTHIGAREYDPSIGQFISVDPLLEADRTQTLNGYSYGAQNPLTFSDPSGMGLACGRGFDTPCPKRPDGSRGVGAPNEGTYGGPPKTQHPCTTCGTADWETEGRGVPADVDNDGYILLLPGVAIPSTTKDVRVFVQAFYAQLEGLTDYGIDSFADHQDVPYVRADIYKALLDSCHLTGCSDWKKFFLSWAKVNAVAGITEGGGKGVTRESGAGRGGCLHSFVAGTEVQLADGSAKPIEDVEIGDKVTVTDPETGKTEAHKVVDTIVTQHDEKFVQVTVDQEGHAAQGSLTATTTHPFWSPSAGGWIDGGELQAGMTLLTPAGRAAKIVEVRHFTMPQVTYDLTIEGVHTYYVLAGATPVLVHNCNKNQGIYEFEDQLNPGKTYVGKTRNFNNRLQDHIDSGRLKSREDATCTHVCGRNDDLFVAEHLRMEKLRGQGVDLSNDIASPGKRILERRQDAEKFEQLGLW